MLSLCTLSYAREQAENMIIHDISELQIEKKKKNYTHNTTFRQKCDLQIILSAEFVIHNQINNLNDCLVILKGMSQVLFFHMDSKSCAPVPVSVFFFHTQDRKHVAIGPAPGIEKFTRTNDCSHMQ